MAPHKTITINGRAYDAATGLPIEGVAPKQTTSAPLPPAEVLKKKATQTSSRAKTNAEAIHSTVQRSKTLNRRVTKKPAAPDKPIARRPSPGKHMDIARSSKVAHFASHPVVEKPVAPVAATAPRPTAPKSSPDKPAQIHPTAHRAIEKVRAKPTPVSRPATARETKEAEITKALATPPQTEKAKKQPKNNKRNKRIILIIGIVLALIVALYGVYRLFPSISVSIASAQAGIEATYPEYTPDGYSLSQPVTFTDGQVDLKFNSNSNDNYYTVIQTRSSWDSSAVLDNVVVPEAGADYTITRERGLTIYTYKSAAAWVNGGILYKIDSKAPLSGDQIRRIATSL
ncbi:MAG: hypothetical protein WAR37_04210 [Candidatus Microsaccharimonas sp.]